MTTFLILPIHLFHHDVLLKALKTIEPPVKHVIILEEPAYYGHHYMNMNYNKLKLIYHRSTMQYYKDYITKHLPTDVSIEYLEYKDLIQSSGRTGGYARIKKNSISIKLFNPFGAFFLLTV
jgi:deoxyribodipyrimidine photolyase-like uncharacterized protein